MIAACLNCGTEFLHASQGRLFYHRGNPRPNPPKAAATRYVEFYWLCGNCAVTHTLKLSANGEVSVIAASMEVIAAQSSETQGSPGLGVCPNCSALALAND